MAESRSISVSEFKATCLDILKQLDEHTLQRVVITRRGRPVAVLTPPQSPTEAVANLHGFMKGSVIMTDDVDLTAPVQQDRFDAEDGIPHR